MFWHKGTPPEDGKQRLEPGETHVMRFLHARLNDDGSESGPVVGYWCTFNHEWRPVLNDNGTELVVDYWAEIPELPT